MLLKHVINYAAERNLPIYLSATPSGWPLYARYGFKVEDEFEIDVSKVSDEKRVNRCMVLPAPRPEEPPVVVGTQQEKEDGEQKKEVEKEE